MLLESAILAKVLEFGLSVVAPVVTMFLMWLAHRLVKVFEEKTKVDVPAALEIKLDEWVMKGIAYAEEKANTAIKNNAEKLKGPEKLEMAVGFVLDMADSQGLDDLAKDKIVKLVESQLGLSRQ